MSNCSETLYEECKIVSSDLDVNEQDVVTLSVYSDTLSSDGQKSICEDLMNFDEDSITCEQKSQNTAELLESSSIFSTNDVDFIDETEKVMNYDVEVSVFESVRATVKKEIYHLLELQNDCEIISAMKKHMTEAVQFYELEYDQLVIVGCLSDLIFCQNTKLYQCDLCEFKTIRLSQLGKHKKSHKQENVSLSGKETLQGKISNDEKFTCEACGFVGKEKKDYRAHLETAHPLKYCCNQCSYSSYKKVHYVRHMKCVHGNERPFMCSLCPMAFKRCDALNQHQVIHIKEAKRQGQKAKASFKCQICKKVVRSAAYLKEHWLTHSEERSFLCEICGSAFKTRAVHRNHMKVMHSDESKPSCETCGKTFATKFSLSRHMTQHGIRSQGIWSNMFMVPSDLLTEGPETAVS